MSAKNKIINLDAAAERYTGVIWVNAIQALASTDSSEVKIVDTDGEIVYHVASDIPNERTYPPLNFAKPQRFNCLTIATFTNMTNVTFYVDRFGD